MTPKFIKCLLSTVLITLALLVVNNHPVSATTDNLNSTVTHSNQHSVNYGLKHVISNPSSLTSNKYTIMDSKDPTYPIAQSRLINVLPDTGKSISHSPVMAGIIALALGSILLIHKKISAKK